MDSINSFKGYGRVDDERTFRKKTNRRCIIIIFSTLVLTAIIGTVIALVHKNSSDNGSDIAPNSSSPTSTAASIKAICSETRYPDSCFSSLSSSMDQKSSSSNKIDPKEIFKLSLKVAMNEVSKISSLPNKLNASINDESAKLALRDCKTLFEDAIDELNTSISSMQVDSKDKLLSTLEIEDLKTWLSSAVTDQESCLDGLKEMNATDLVTKMQTAMRNSTEYTSNSLAIVAKIMGVLDKLGITIHRKLLETESMKFKEFPEWMSHGDRRLLQGTNLKPDLTVAKDGTGNFKTIQEAVNAVEKKKKTKTVIYVKAGEYIENVLIDKAYWNILMYGDGKTKTVVSGNLNKIDGTPTFSTASFIVTGKGFIARDMGFKNTAGPDKHQAVAMRSGSDRSAFYRCSFDAYQDTLYAHSNRQFYRECDITGTVDFIFGNAVVIFQNCIIQPRQPLQNQFNTVTAQGKKDPNQNTGISIQRCSILPNGNVTARTYLGRPWKDFSTTVIMESTIDGVVDPVGWIEWVPNTEPPRTIYYGEHRNTGAGASVEKRVKWAGYKPVIGDEEAGRFTVESFIQGSKWLPGTNVKFDSKL